MVDRFMHWTVMLSRLILGMSSSSFALMLHVALSKATLKGVAFNVVSSQTDIL